VDRRERAGRWFTTFGKVIDELEMTDTKLVAGAPKYHYAAGAYAYVVVPLSITSKVDGKPYTESGSVAFTLQLIGGAWKISAQAWAKGPESFNPY
jgi:hypothetical protein